MNKRTRSKQIKKMNIGKHEAIFKKLSKVFTIKNKRFGNGYFIIRMGKNSVCYFDILEVPEWTFGIWLGEKGFKIFGEHNDLIDKFKPSRTYVSHEDDLEGFITQVQAIQANPKLYFVDSLTGDALEPFKEHHWADNDITYSGYQVVRKYNEETKRWDIIEQDTSITQEAFVEKEFNEYYEEKRIQKEKEEADKKYAFDFFKELPNLFDEIEAVGITDRNRKGWRCSPRYDIRVIVSPEMSQAELIEFDKVLDKFITEKNFNEVRETYEHGFHLVDYFDDKLSLKECDYRYFKKKYREVEYKGYTFQIPGNKEITQEDLETTLGLLEIHEKNPDYFKSTVMFDFDHLKETTEER